MGWQTDGESNRAGEETESSLCVKQKKSKSLKWKKIKFGQRMKKTLNHTTQKLKCLPKF